MAPGGRCAYYTGHSSIYETVENQLYVCNRCTTKNGFITSYFNVCFPCYAKGNHKRHMKHMTVDKTYTFEHLAYQIMEYQDLDNDFNANSLLNFFF